MSNTTLATLLFLVAGGLAAGCDGSPGSDAERSAPDAATAADAATTAPAAKASKRALGRTPKIAPGSRVPESDPIVAVLAEPDPFARTAQLSNLLAGLGPEAVSSTRALLNGLRDGSQSFGVAECSLLVEFWSRHDAERAANWALGFSPRGYRSAIIMPPVERWAAQDPAAAAEAVQKFRQSRGLHTELAEVALVRGWFDGGKPGLEDYIRNLGVGFDRQRLIAALAGRISDTQGPEAAFRWAEGLPEDDRRYKLAAYRQTAKAVALRVPTAAADWCEGVCEGPFGDGVRSMIAQNWGYRDGQPAMDWVSQAPPGPSRDRAVKDAFRGWWPVDREGFMQWAAELERDGIPDWFQPAIENYAAGLTIAAALPEEGVRWALYIEDDVARERTLVNVARNWRRHDEAAAEAWLETSPLSEEARDRVRNPVAGRGFMPFPEPEAP